MPTVTLTAGPSHGGYVVDAVTRTRWLIGQSHVIDDPGIESRLAPTAKRGYIFTFTSTDAPVVPAVPAPAPEPPTPAAAPAAS